MKVVAFSDTHGLHQDVDVPDGDVLIFVGDACQYGTELELINFTNWWNELEFKHKIFVAGNHDWPLSPKKRKKPVDFWFNSDTLYLQHESTTIEGVSFFGSPWQPAFCDWAFNLPRGKRLRAMWEDIPDDVDVLLTHTPPHGVLDAVDGKGSVGCRELSSRVWDVRPKLHLFGHIHEQEGIVESRGTIYSNVSYLGGMVEPYTFTL